MVITSGFQPEDRGSIPLTRSGIMKLDKMTKENLQMLFSLMVVTTLSFFGSPASDLTAQPETATVAEPIEEIIEGATEAKEVQPTLPQETQRNAPDSAVLPDSFNEGDIENEFSDVQTGIDLLDNPLQ